MIRWGILGAGSIARKLASDIALVDNAELVAIGSRSKEKAAAFAKEFNIPHINYSYEELAANPDVDVVYVATPHSLPKTLIAMKTLYTPISRMVPPASAGSNKRSGTGVRGLKPKLMSTELILPSCPLSTTSFILL